MATRRAGEASVTAAHAAAFRLQRQHLARSTKHVARSNQHAGRSTEHVVDICRDTAGIQAQVMSAADLSIWTRRRQTTRAEIQKALWETRDIVRTSAMRLTLHLIPARDLAIYIAAVKPAALRRLQYWQARMGAKPHHVRAMVDAVADSLTDEPRTQQELIAVAKKKASRGLATWLKHVGIPVRPAVIEGRIVYGPPRGAEATFVRADAWLGPQTAVGLEEARVELLRRFLGAFGPATPHDFAKWSGMNTSDARRVFESARGALAAVSVEGATGWVLGDDVRELMRSELNPDAVTLLGAFDSFLLAHATKEHLVDARFYKRVYRPQGWISPVVLRGGTIIGVWFPESAGQRTTLGVELFGRATPEVRRAIEREAEAMSAFLGTTCSPRFRS